MDGNVGSGVLTQDCRYDILKHTSLIFQDPTYGSLQCTFKITLICSLCLKGSLHSFLYSTPQTTGFVCQCWGYDDVFYNLYNFNHFNSKPQLGHHVHHICLLSSPLKCTEDLLYHKHFTCMISVLTTAWRRGDGDPYFSMRNQRFSEGK